jgi:TonB family protein
VDGGVAALAHDYVASQPLSVVFDRAQSEDFPIPIDNALLVTEKIALALSAALTEEVDGERVLHGFVHPALVYVTYDGECVVAGFGLGEQFLGALAADEHPELHRYLAPEVLESRTASRRGDVYSLGAILYHLLTGSPLPVDPTARLSALEGATLAGGGQPIPDDIRVLLKRSLAARAQERFSSASDFKKELDRLLYGGSYSPTTFNLALFMDRLFRTEAEADEAAVEVERAVDVEPYQAPPEEASPQPLVEESTVAAPPSRRWIILAGAAVVVIAAVVATAVFIGRRPAAGPPPNPTPTVAEIAAQRQAQEDRMRELAQSLVREMMAEKEAEIRAELQERQATIDELQRRLATSEQQAREGRLSLEQQRQQEELRRRIAAEEAAQRQREADLEAERQEADEAAREQVRSELVTAAAAGNLDGSGPAPRVPSPATGQPASLSSGQVSGPPTNTPTVVVLPSPTTLPLPTPTAPPPPSPSPGTRTAAAPAAEAVAFNTFVDPTQVDSQPVVIKDQRPVWSQAAQRSRRRGIIIIQATVNGSGEVDEVRILRADESGFGIPEAALAAARGYRFKPALKNGTAVSTHATITVPYRFATIR